MVSEVCLFSSSEVKPFLVRRKSSQDMIRWNIIARISSEESTRRSSTGRNRHDVLQLGRVVDVASRVQVDKSAVAGLFQVVFSLKFSTSVCYLFL